MKDLIEFNELREGNYVLANNPHYENLEIKRVFDIQEEAASLEGLGLCINKGKIEQGVNIDRNLLIFSTNPYVYQLIEPLPLTNELLLKCGFEEIKDGKTYILPLYFHKSNDIKSNNYLCFYCEKGKGVYALYTEYLKDVSFEVKDPVLNNKPCTYLHQLQNLYFDITGEELGVKL
ncbi:hypothetical protein [Bacteroides sp.]|uniref:hypothetical protein n=1 Tax=Bacteroides sp. TaxID=29523 RepID=UPI00262B1624|nr:hypothetical protein [Bacteroides sp.]